MHSLRVMTPEQIKNFRLTHEPKLSQSQLAEMLGVDQATVSRAELGRSPLPKSAELLLARIVADKKVAAA
jgi:DNA-binding transcriptional regulator YiaG